MTRSAAADLHNRVNPPPHLTLIIQLLFISFMRDGGRVTIWHCHLPSRYHQFKTTNHPSCYWTRTAPGSHVGLQNEPRSKVWKT